MTELRYIDLFSGAGGLSLGLFNSRLKGVFAIEKNKDAFETLKFNLIDNKNHFEWPEWLPIIHHDINQVLEKYTEQLIALQGKVDLVVGGPPCQGFSMAGKRSHTDLRNTLVHSYLEVVKHVQPNYVFFENVTGFKVRFKEDDSKVPYSDIVIRELENMGYHVESHTILMSDYGIPQKRKRYILVASKTEDFAKSFFNNLIEQRKSFFEDKKICQFVTVKEAIGDLLKSNGLTESIDSSKKFSNGLYGQAYTNYQKLMRCNAPEIPNSHRFANHSSKIVELHMNIMNNVTPGKRITPSDKIIDGLKRRGVTLLDSDGISPTITSIPDELVHYAEPRILTPRETARLQSFPDWYFFKGKYTSGGKLRKNDVPRYTQIGNAVPPLFAEQVGLVFAKTAIRLAGDSIGK